MTHTAASGERAGGRSRVQISSGGKSRPLRRINSSCFADAELTTHRTMVHTAPNTQLRTTVCITSILEWIDLQNNAQTFRNG
jgi:hypothetical protein